MTNIENVIKNLNTIAACCKLLTNIKTCSGIDEEMYADWADTIGETVLLLKEQNAREQCLKTKQEAIKPSRHYTRCSTNHKGMDFWYNCGSCKAEILENDKYCHECGQAVKWE